MTKFMDLATGSSRPTPLKNTICICLCIIYDFRPKVCRGITYIKSQLLLAPL